MDDLKMKQIAGSLNAASIVRKTKQINIRDKKISSGESFESILNKVQTNGGKIKFSKHAQDRIESRNINFSDQDVKNIENAVDRARDKGVQTALILMDKVALITNIKNNLVITTVNKEQLKENVFTNIDGAVII
ncbi:MAG: flagellar protein [Tissierellales bacterium]|nr:flagellar protein [Tissierellales bacterium]